MGPNGQLSNCHWFEHRQAGKRRQYHRPECLSFPTVCQISFRLRGPLRGAPGFCDIRMSIAYRNTMTRRLPPNMRGSAEPEPAHEPNSRFVAPVPARRTSVENEVYVVDRSAADLGLTPLESVSRLTITAHREPSTQDYVAILSRTDYDQKRTYHVRTTVTSTMVTDLDTTELGRLMSMYCDHADEILVARINDDREAEDLPLLARVDAAPEGPLKHQTDTLITDIGTFKVGPNKVTKVKPSDVVAFNKAMVAAVRYDPRPEDNFFKGITNIS